MEKKCDRCGSNGFYAYENEEVGKMWLMCLDCDKIHGPYLPEGEKDAKEKRQTDVAALQHHNGIRE